MDNYLRGPDLGRILESQKIENEIVKLRKEVNELNNELNKRKQVKKDEITLAQQLLLLYYLGLLNEIDLNTKDKSFLLSKILNRSKDNIKKVITYINSPKISLSKIKNVQNLELVLNIFEALKMPEVADKVKVDINKLNKV
ncbi:MAG: hypothetical protein NTY95_18475 [Bacteroidia bacterium]|nr:hypothetical protein [Bacteroidia bacterium]